MPTTNRFRSAADDLKPDASGSKEKYPHPNVSAFAKARRNGNTNGSKEGAVLLIDAETPSPTQEATNGVRMLGYPSADGSS